MKTCKEVFEFKASQMNNTITGPHQTDTMDESELHIKFLITLAQLSMSIHLFSLIFW